MIYHDSKCRGGPSPKKKSQPESEDGKVVITADNPVSCLYEYAKKVAKNNYCQRMGIEAPRLNMTIK